MPPSRDEYRDLCAVSRWASLGKGGREVKSYGNDWPLGPEPRLCTTIGRGGGHMVVDLAVGRFRRRAFIGGGNGVGTVVKMTQAHCLGY